MEPNKFRKSVDVSLNINRELSFFVEKDETGYTLTKLLKINKDENEFTRMHIKNEYLDEILDIIYELKKIPIGGRE